MVPAPPYLERACLLQLGGLLLRLKPANQEEFDTYLLTMESGLDLSLQEGQLALELDDNPIIQVTLIDARSASPLQATLIKAVVEGTVWTDLKGALASGFDFGISSFEISPESFAEVAPAVQSLSVTPSLGDKFSIRDKVLNVEGGLDILMSVDPQGVP